MDSKAFRARGISCDYSCFEIKGVTYRPLGTEIDLLNGISFSVPEKSCCEKDDMHKAAGNGPYITTHAAGNPAGYHATETAQKDKQTINMQPIAVPAVPVDELRDITDNFGSKTLIGEGSYGRVYHGVLKSGQAAAVKKLNSSKQPDQEYLAQGIA